MQRYLSGLLLTIVILSLLPPLSLSRSAQGTLLGTKIYLKATNSSTPGFKTVSLVKPTGSTNNSISLNASASGSYLIGSWILPWVFSSITISSKYNFLFCMYGNGSGLAMFYGELLIYRGGAINQSIFNSSLSSPLSVNASNGLLWQSKTSQNITFLSGDRLVFRLHLKAENGLYAFWYDSLAFPSYFTDPSETRYMRGDQQTINGLLAYILGTSQSTIPQISEGSALAQKTVYWSSDVVVIHANGSETVIGSKIAVVSRAVDGIGIQSASWTCPLTSLVSSDAVVIKVYDRYGALGTWVLRATFITEQLGASQLGNVEWTFYYYTGRAWDFDFNITYGIFKWGSSTYNSRIENFTWTEAISGAWNYISAWPFSLTARTWNQIAFWPFTLMSGMWNPISSWILSLNVRSWQNINFWIFTLRSPGWNSVSFWTFQLLTLGWHSIAFWIFSLTPFSTGFLLIPLIFLVGVVLFLMAVALGKKFQNEF